MPLPAIWLVFVRDILWPQWALLADATVVTLAAHFMDARGHLVVTGPAAAVEAMRARIGVFLGQVRGMHHEVLQSAELYHPHNATVLAALVQHQVAMYVDTRTRAIQLLADSCNEGGLQEVKLVLKANQDVTIVADLPPTVVVSVASWLLASFPTHVGPTPTTTTNTALLSDGLVGSLRVERLPDTNRLTVSGRRVDVVRAFGVVVVVVVVCESARGRRDTTETERQRLLRQSQTH